MEVTEFEHSHSTVTKNEEVAVAKFACESQSFLKLVLAYSVNICNRTQIGFALSLSLTPGREGIGKFS